MIAVAVVVIYSALITWGLLMFVNATVGIRVSPEEEARGLDVSQHGETAYQI